MDINYYKQYEPIFGEWYIKKFVGEGGFGQVYEIERNEFGKTYTAALKTITIPQTKSEAKSIKADGMTEEDVSEYYKSVVKDIVSECVLLSKLKGNSNIVSYEDHKIIEHQDDIGWDILIKMELLTPLFDYMENTDLAKRDVIKLGIDICKAIELCQKYNIIHRDIKPENIFISPSGDYKLGDFGIARTVEKTTNGLSQKGTSIYMAPEVYKGYDYDSTVDIYSLGIVLYRLLNENRIPFLPEYPIAIKYEDREKALLMRIKGEKIPKPKNADGRLAEIVLKACAYNAEDRYSSAMHMRMELESILYNASERKLIFPDGDKLINESVEYVNDSNNTEIIQLEKKTKCNEEKTEIGVICRYNNNDKEDGTEIIKEKIKEESISDDSNKKEKYKRRRIIYFIIACIIVAVGVLIYFINKPPVISGIEDPIEFEKGEAYEVNYSIKTYGRDKDNISVDCIIEDTEIAKIKTTEENNNITLTGKKVGETSMEVIVDDHSYYYTVEVKPATVTAIKGVDSTIKVAKGSSKTIKPIIEPKAAQTRKIHYSIKDEDIAEISDKGKIKGKKTGKTTLTIKVGDMEEKAEIKVYKKKKKSNKSSTAQTNNTQSNSKSAPSNNTSGNNHYYEWWSE